MVDWDDLAPGSALIYMRPPLTCLFILLIFNPLSMLSERNPMALFLGSTAFLYEPLIRRIGGHGSEVSILKSVTGDCDFRSLFVISSSFLRWCFSFFNN